MNSIPPEELEKQHRYFASLCNNQAWDLSELENRTKDQTEQMITLAYAAKFHWQQVGTSLNVARADLLLAHALSLSTSGEQALTYANNCLTFFNSENSGAQAWDRAFAQVELAFAYAVLGEQSKWRVNFQSAKALMDYLENEEEQKLLLAEFEHIKSVAEKCLADSKIQ